jgi:hypothetical protein
MATTLVAILLGLRYERNAKQPSCSGGLRDVPNPDNFFGKSHEPIADLTL